MSNSGPRPRATAVHPNDAGDADLFHVQVLPALTAKAKPKKVKRGKKFTVKVTDVGTRVKGAEVKFLGKTYKTKANGKVKITVKKKAKAKKVTITVSKAGYASGSVKVKVKK